MICLFLKGRNCLKKKEDSKLSKAYENKVDVVNIITAPEIEILAIIKEDKYLDFKKSKLKPSDYCKQVLRMSHVKNYDSVIEYFSDADTLVEAIKNIRK